MPDYVEELRAVVSAGNAVFVLGTGVSKSLSDNHSQADWVGLIRHGIERGAHLSGDSDWESFANSSLDYALKANNAGALISAASTVQKKFQEIGIQAYSQWLQDSVGALDVTTPALGEALAATGCPLLTTNYDGLLESVTGRASAVWSRVEGMRDALRNDPPTIGHIHGYWREADSVILSDADYERVLGNEPAQHLQAANFASKIFVFVGYGSGLADPNFGWMLKTHSRLFPEARHMHYRLTSASSLEALEREHSNDNIRVTSYGSSHHELADFIASLSSSTKTSVTRQDYVSFAREAIVEQVRDEAVIGDSGALDLADTPMEDLVVEPILLPLPHDKFVTSQDSSTAVKPVPLDPADVYSHRKLVVVAGEEGAGVTTALRWLAFQASVSRLGAAPLYVDARRCRGSSHALDKEVHQQALAQRLIDSKKQPLPDHILAVDNVLPASTAAFRSLIEDVISSSASTIFLGTRQGNEAELVDLVAASKLPIEVTYLGKPGRGQVRALASLIAPDSHSGLVDQVINVLRREHLQRTPFNICLLLMLLSQGAGSMSNASDTAVLDKYVQLLTGRTGNFLDPRWTLDPQNREAVLGDLARRMVRERRGSMTRSEVHAHFDEYFRSVDWSEDSLETLRSLTKMRVLRVQGESVSFQQSGYLHLFAAKAAIEDAEFLEEILGDPLYFSPIIRHYAALVRNSEKVARHLLTALEDQWPSVPPTGPLYQTIKLAAAPSIAKVNEAASVAEAAPEMPDPTADLVEEHSVYDWSDDSDARPFPLDDPNGWPLTAQLTWGIDLASRVVRDSDQIRNLKLKDDLFTVVLDRWGYLLDLLSGDPALDELADAILDAAEEEEGEVLGEDERATKRNEMKRQIPAFYVYAGISTTLASRKLLLPLDRVSSQNTATPIYFDTAAAMLAASMNIPGWAARLPALAKKYGTVTVVAEFVLPLMGFAYRYQSLTDEDEASLQHFLKTELGQLHEWPSKRERDLWVDGRLQAIIRDRKMSVRKRLAEGQNALDALGTEEY